jgi:AcrR family transcriptional regulator
MTALSNSSRPMRADAARNRKALLDAARDAFSRHGVSASLDDVARAAGVGPGTLYRHFPTRDQLVLAVIDDGLRGLHALGESLLADPDPVAALQRWLAAYIEQGGMYEGMARTLVNPGGPEGKDACAMSRAAGAALITRAASTGLIRTSTNVEDVLDLAAAIAWVGEQPARDPRQPTRLLAILVDGLQVPSAG